MGLTGSAPFLTVIPSTSPKDDANSFVRIFDSFIQEDVGLDDSTVTLIQNDHPPTDGGTTVLFIEQQGIPSTNTPSVLIVSSIPNKAIDIVKQEDMEVLVPPSNDGMAEILTALIQFKGGSRLLVATNQVLELADGRQRLAQILVNPESITEFSNNEPFDGDFVHIDVRGANLDRKEREMKFAISDLSSEYQTTALMQGGTTYRLPRLPTLDVSLLGRNNVYEPNYPVNAPTPVPFETDLFKGQLVFIMRPDGDPATEDPYWNERIFSKKKRRFIIQLQGKFKRKPRGTVYAGAEVTEPMKLGLVSKGVCSILLKLISSFNSDMHYSFGDKKRNEQAHIVIPAWSFFERIVVTKPGETPPVLGGDLEESKASVQERKSGRTNRQWNTEDTYSMSYHSMYLDLPNWQVVKLPVAPTLALATFWGKSNLKIVLYENSTPENDSRHLKKDNGYFFGIQMRYLGAEARNNDARESMPWSLKTRTMSESSIMVNFSESDSVLSDKYQTSSSGLNLAGAAPTILEESDGEECYFFDAEEAGPEVSVESIEMSSSAHDAESISLLRRINLLCPMWIDMCIKGKYTKTYAFNVGGETRFRLAPMVSDYLDTDQAKAKAEQLWSPRLSNAERTRRRMGHALALALEKKTSESTRKMNAFVTMRTSFDKEFLQERPISISPKREKLIKKSGFVARAFSDHHWIEEWMKVTDTQLAFYHPQRSTKANMRVNLDSILAVSKLPRDQRPPLPSFHFMTIATLGRTIYVMFATETDCDGWVSHLSKYVDPTPTGQNPDAARNSDLSGHLMSLNNPSDEFLHNSSMWQGRQRRVLNCRKFSFQPSGTANDGLKLAEESLLLAIEPKNVSEEANLIAFLDSTSRLKDVDVSELSEDERLVFFLNLYHVMIMHAFLVLGTPDSSLKWINYFNTISYQCSDDIFSLTEMEHCIIRSAMNYPSQFVSKFVLPKSKFPFALTRSDFRINFALNCGSLSNPSLVPVYRADTLSSQLDAACRTYLEVADATENKKTVLTLPRVCQWYSDDFEDIVRNLKPYLGEKIQALLNGKTDISIKYLAYNFECRHLALFPGPADSKAFYRLSRSQSDRTD